jgi:hypothetical protein
VKPAYRIEFNLCPDSKWIDEFMAECCRTNQVMRATIKEIVAEKWIETQRANNKAAKNSDGVEVDETATDDGFGGKEEVMTKGTEGERVENVRQADGEGDKTKGAERKDEKQAREKQDSGAENEEDPKVGNEKNEKNAQRGEDRQNTNGEEASQEKSKDGRGGDKGEFEFPLGETVNVTAILEDLKEQVSVSASFSTLAIR